MAKAHVVPTGGVEREPFIPYVKESAYPDELKPIFEPYMKRMGFLPNALKLYMHRPEISAPLWTLNSKIMRDKTSTLDQNLKRRLAAVICKVNGCTYCTAHSCAMLTKPVGIGPEGWGMDDNEVIAMLRPEGLAHNEMEQVCFDFAAAASHSPQTVPDEIYDRLVTHLTPPQVMELACVVGFWKMYNTIHDALRIPIEGHLVEESAYIDV